jgi:hypothetical protein
MNRKDFLKRLGLLTTTAVVIPTILAEQSQVATTKSVERMRITSSGNVKIGFLPPNAKVDIGL